MRPEHEQSVIPGSRPGSRSRQWSLLRTVPPIMLAIGVFSLGFALQRHAEQREQAAALPVVSPAKTELLTYEQSYGPVQRPTSVAVDEAGFVYVVDSDLAQVTVFRPDGVIERRLGARPEGGGEEPGTLVSPLGVATDADRRVYVSDLGARQILIFSPDGRFAGRFAEDEISQGTPGALLFHNGHLYVCDVQRQAVLVFDANGLLVRTITGELELSYPNGVWVWPDGAITIADSGNNRLLEVDTAGATVRTIEADLLSPRALGADGSGRLFVASMLDQRVAILERSGGELSELTAVSGQGLGFPTGVAVRGDSLYVTDRAAAAVHRWRINAS